MVSKCLDLLWGNYKKAFSESPINKPFLYRILSLFLKKSEGKNGIFGDFSPIFHEKNFYLVILLFLFCLSIY